MAVGIADLFHRRAIRAKPVGDDLPRSAVPIHDPLEKLQRRSLVPLRFASTPVLSSHQVRLRQLGPRGVVQRMDMDLSETKDKGRSSSQNGGKGREAKIVALIDETISDTKMRNDVISVCGKVQSWAKRNPNEVADAAGRDLIFYNKSAYVSFWNSAARSAEYQLTHWNAASEPTGDTVAMLMDFALAWKHSMVQQKSRLDLYAEDYARQRTEFRQTRRYLEEKGLEELLPGQEVERKEANSKRLVTDADQQAQGKGQDAVKGFNPTSDLYKLKESKGYAISAGPSSSTASVLWFLRRVGTVTQEEAKSVTRALASKYWGEGLKNLSGEFHCQFEATIPLARHLSKFSEGKEI